MTSFTFADFHKFMLVAESMSAIIFPFIWQHVYVPILPPALSHFLDAPVPFLMGIYCASEEDKKNLVLPSEVSLAFSDSFTDYPGLSQLALLSAEPGE